MQALVGKLICLAWSNLFTPRLSPAGILCFSLSSLILYLQLLIVVGEYIFEIMCDGIVDDDC